MSLSLRGAKGECNTFTSCIVHANTPVVSCNTPYHALQTEDLLEKHHSFNSVAARSMSAHIVAIGNSLSPDISHFKGI